MIATIECIPCLTRQGLEAIRLVTSDVQRQRSLLNEVLRLLADTGTDVPAPAIARDVHRLIRERTNEADPYRTRKTAFNQLAWELLPHFGKLIGESEAPLLSAVRIAVAANVIDLGVNGQLRAESVQRDMEAALAHPLQGDYARFRQAVESASDVLYIADNAGELVFDRLLIEQLAPKSVTVAVRGGPVINDATLDDAVEAGIPGLAHLMDTGSDAPGTYLEHCSEAFLSRFAEADLIIAKGQGNFESLSEVPADIFFLFKVKCPVVAAASGYGLGDHLVLDQRRIHYPEESNHAHKP